MTTKLAMLEELGATEVLIPTLIGRALAANDAAKYVLALLQTAVHRADHPDSRVPNLRREREAARVEVPEFDLVVDGTVGAESGYRIPELGRIGRLIDTSIAAMLEPLTAAGAADPAIGDLVARRDRLAPLWRDLGEFLEGPRLSRLTSGVREEGDSVHLLVMDLHRALDRLQRELSPEVVGGALVLAVEPAFRPLVEAFMAGIRRTAPLKFDHPGLGTTATQVGNRLVLQNDIGTTDVHLLLVGVEDEVVTVTYSDLHPRRLAFFQHLLASHPVEWREASAGVLAEGREGGGYQLAVGRFQGADGHDVRRFLEYLGSRLVFLIDWNRARKRLRRFVPKKRAIDLLEWAADEDVGHMGWLLMGGEQLVFEALESSRLPIRLGEELHEILGAEVAVDYLKFVLRSCSEGLRRARSDFLIRDEIRVELARHLRATRQTLLTLAADHGTLAVDLAVAFRDGLPGALRGDRASATALAERARRWEHEGDNLLNQARGFSERWSEGGRLVDLLGKSDDVIDILEEAAFHLTLAGTEPVESSLFSALIELGDVTVAGAREYRKALENARLVIGGAGRQEWADFSEALDRVLLAEHQGDEMHRRVRTALVNSASTPRQLEVLGDVARGLEKATDCLMHVALALRTLLREEAAA